MEEVKNSKNHSKISQMINLVKPELINISVFYSINNWENYESVNLLLESNTTISQLLNLAKDKFKNELYYDDIDNKELNVMFFKKKTKKPNYDYPICDKDSLIQDYSKNCFCIVERINDEEQLSIENKNENDNNYLKITEICKNSCGIF
jgi:hypothetical protein